VGGETKNPPPPRDPFYRTSEPRAAISERTDYTGALASAPTPSAR
jgi:hypothetical protein